MKRLLLSLMTAAWLPACTAPGAEEPAPDFEEHRGARLGVVTQQDVERELQSGYGCSLETSQGQILVAVQGDAIARPSNNLIHMQFTGTSLYEGGTFVRGAFSIRVAPVESHGTIVEEVVQRRASVTVTEGPLSRQFEARWACGA